MLKGRFRFDEETGEFIQVQTETGREVPDPTPVSLPVRARTPLPLAEQVARLVRSSEWNAHLRGDVETFAEADDFDVDDDFDPATPYETEFDPVLNREITPKDFEDPARRDHYKNEYLIAERNAQRAEERQRVLDEAYKAYYRRKQRGAAEGAAPSSKKAE